METSNKGLWGKINMPTETKNTEQVKLYFKKKLKWYEKIWYLITGKKNEYQELRYGSDIDVGNIK